MGLLHKTPEAPPSSPGQHQGFHQPAAALCSHQTSIGSGSSRFLHHVLQVWSVFSESPSLLSMPCKHALTLRGCISGNKSAVMNSSQISMSSHLTSFFLKPHRLSQMPAELSFSWGLGALHGVPYVASRQRRGRECEGTRRS